jgi:hypothetical protein
MLYLLVATECRIGTSWPITALSREASYPPKTKSTEYNSDLLLPIVRGQYFAVTDTDRKSGRAGVI